MLLIDADAQGSLTASFCYTEPDTLEITLATIMGGNAAVGTGCHGGKSCNISMVQSVKSRNIAYDLKTPMMVISGYSENFLAEIQTEKRTHYAEKILENGDKMNTIVEEMLEFTKTKQAD